MEIKNGVYLVDGIKGANSYLNIDDRGILIIDTGMPGNAKKIFRQVKALNKTNKEIKLIILTHSDIDHSGSAAELKEITGAKIAIHSCDAPSLSGEESPKRVKGFLGVLFKVMTIFVRFQTIKPDVILKDGHGIENFKVIHTPGHTKGSICLYKAGDVLFAGDAIRTDKEGNLKLSPNIMNLNPQEALESVRKIAGLEFDILLPGHGVPAIGKASAKVKDLLTHRIKSN